MVSCWDLRSLTVSLRIPHPYSVRKLRSASFDPQAYNVDLVPIADCVLRDASGSMDPMVRGSTDLNIDSALCDAAGSGVPIVRGSI